MDYERGSIGWMFKSFSSMALAKVLSQINGQNEATSNLPLDLVVSPQLIKFLDAILSKAALKESGVDKIYKLEDGISDQISSRRCYLISNNPAFTRIIANHLNASRKPIICWVVYVPRILKICEIILEEQGVYGMVSIMELPLSFVPLDSDLFSLEQDDFFNLFFLRNNYHVVHNIATAIAQLREIFGRIAQITAIGKCSTSAVKLFDRLVSTRSFPKSPTTSSAQCIDHLILFDRNIDYLSLLLSPVNYQGLVDEKFTINCSRIRIPESISKKEGLSSSYFFLQNYDIVYKHIRDLHFIDASQQLRNFAKGFLVNIERNKNMTIEEMKDFVENELRTEIRSQRSLKLHIALCEIIMDEKQAIDFRRILEIERLIIERINYSECLEFIEESIIKQLCPLVCLRLICLLSLLNDGLPAKHYDNLANLYFQSFGHQYMLNFYNLGKLGILVKQKGVKFLTNSPATKVTNVLQSTKVASVFAGLQKSHTHNILKRFNQVTKIISESAKIKDAGYVYGANYIPLINKIVEMVVNEETNTKDSLDFITRDNTHRILGQKEKQAEKIVVIVATGGLSYAEVSTLRYLADKENIQLIMCTTSIASGNRLIQQTGVDDSVVKKL